MGTPPSCNRARRDEFRAATNKSLTDMALSELVRLGGNDAATLRDKVMASGDVSAASILMRDHFFALAEETPARADVMAQRDRWNESNPDMKININMASVIKQVRAMREDKATRLEKASPKGLRAQVRAELAQ